MSMIFQWLAWKQLMKIGSEEASRLLTTYADLKMKEAETLQDMVALIKADDLGPHQCYEIVKHITKDGR